MILRILPLVAMTCLLCHCETTDSGGASGSGRVDVRASSSGSSPRNAKKIPVGQLSKRYKELLDYQAMPLTVYGSEAEIKRARRILEGQGFQAVETKKWP